MHVQDFPAEPTEAIEGALASALASAAAAEGISFSDVSCVRDYSLACPSGVGCVLFSDACSD